MKTVKEVSELTGISIRTLRYYDEIDLLKPAKVTEAGYCIFRKNCASVPEERSAIPLQTEQSSAG